ncbi:hypothetical protein GCM10009676_00020 [Prauserella halophila]|uniref:Prepilin type IV endopeptidase peptidase domain-containing protein n=1 Tax=Prauserella halophila TaxID=185641 RepID=A0ABN1VTP7_9PSEU|nr:hypothetical protein [Prauserella halophila]MCP2234654.1 hypothetical protein [Prauserella halophila]
MSETTRGESVAGGALRASVVPVVSGLLAGAFVAWCYYDDVLRSLAHTFTVWVVLAVAVARRRTLADAYVRVAALLLAAVFSFYGFRSVFYVVLYGGFYPPPLMRLVTWFVLALAAGLVLAFVLRHIGVESWWGSLACAGAIGLVLGDLVRQFDDDDVALLAVSGAAIGVIAWLGIPSARQAARVAGAVVPCAVLGFGVVLLPDLLEDLVMW